MKYNSKFLLVWTQAVAKSPPRCVKKVRLKLGVNYYNPEGAPHFFHAATLLHTGEWLISEDLQASKLWGLAHMWHRFKILVFPYESP